MGMQTPPISTSAHKLTTSITHSLTELLIWWRKHTGRRAGREAHWCHRAVTGQNSFLFAAAAAAGAGRLRARRSQANLAICIREVLLSALLSAPSNANCQRLYTPVHHLTCQYSHHY